MLGIDIVDIERIKKIYHRHGQLFLEKILDDKEIKDLLLKEDCHFFKTLSCYIASKEAIFKACSEENFDWKDISIRNITKAPSIYIKRPDFKKKIRLTLAVEKEIVLSQALIVHH